MKYLGIVLLFFSLTSCDYFDKKKINAEDILNEELKTFNWSEVDEYPTFQSCKDANSQTAKKQCFENTLTAHISNYLGKENIVVTQDVNDTIVIKFLISETGDLSVLNVKSAENTKIQIPKIDTLLVNSLKGLPKIYPAIKRSQQVKTEFKLPIIISVN